MSQAQKHPITTVHHECQACGGTGKRWDGRGHLLIGLVVSLLLYIALATCGYVLLGTAAFVPAFFGLSALFHEFKPDCPECAGAGRQKVRRCDRCGHDEWRDGAYCSTCGVSWRAAGVMRRGSA